VFIMPRSKTDEAFCFSLTINRFFQLLFIETLVPRAMG
jgi:hypothetical protein